MKKSTNIHRLVLTITFVALFLNSCSNELYENTTQQENGLIIKKVSLKNLPQSENMELFKSVAKIRPNHQNIQAKMVYDSINKIYFDDENGKEITAPDGKKSYTFPMYTEESDGKVISPKLG
jgi:PBP1b-binding outer membrane lipoprotein LpoB